MIGFKFYKKNFIEKLKKLFFIFVVLIAFFIFNKKSLLAKDEFKTKEALLEEIKSIEKTEDKIKKIFHNDFDYSNNQFYNAVGAEQKEYFYKIKEAFLESLNNPFPIYKDKYRISLTIPYNSSSNINNIMRKTKTAATLFTDIHKELFFFNGAFSINTSSYHSMSTEITLNIDYDFISANYFRGEKLNETINRYYVLFNYLINIAKMIPSDYEKALFFHDWLIYHNQYNEPALRNPNTDSARLSHTPISALFPELSPVCQGYSELYYLILNKLNIPTLYAVGYTTERHGWNYVLLNGKWYFVDITFDDPIGGLSKYYIGYKHFLTTTPNTHKLEKGYPYSTGSDTERFTLNYHKTSNYKNQEQLYLPLFEKEGLPYIKKTYDELEENPLLEYPIDNLDITIYKDGEFFSNGSKFPKEIGIYIFFLFPKNNTHPISGHLSFYIEISELKNPFTIKFSSNRKLEDNLLALKDENNNPITKKELNHTIDNTSKLSKINKLFQSHNEKINGYKLSGFLVNETNKIINFTNDITLKEYFSENIISKKEATIIPLYEKIKLSYQTLGQIKDFNTNFASKLFDYENLGENKFDKLNQNGELFYAISLDKEGVNLLTPNTQLYEDSILFIIYKMPLFISKNFYQSEYTPNKFYYFNEKDEINENHFNDLISNYFIIENINTDNIKNNQVIFKLQSKYYKNILNNFEIKISNKLSNSNFLIKDNQNFIYLVFTNTPTSFEILNAKITKRDPDQIIKGFLLNNNYINYETNIKQDDEVIIDIKPFNKNELLNNIKNENIKYDQDKNLLICKDPNLLNVENFPLSSDDIVLVSVDKIPNDDELILTVRGKSSNDKNKILLKTQNALSNNTTPNITTPKTPQKNTVKLVFIGIGGFILAMGLFALLGYILIREDLKKKKKRKK